MMVKAVLLITRPAQSGARFVAGIAPDLLRQVQVIDAPLIDIQPTGAAFDATAFGGVIFTSANAVAHAGAGKGQPAFCVGARTTQAAQAAGWAASCAGQTAAELIATLTQTRPTGPLLHLGGAHRRGDIDGHLTRAGIPTEVCVIYQQQVCPLTLHAQDALEGEHPVVVPLFSPRTATQFRSTARSFENVVGVALSPAVAQPLTDVPVRAMHILSSPTSPEMMRRVEKVLADVTSP